MSAVFTSGAFTCRPLEADEWKTFRDIRLEALQKHPGFYGGTYAEEKDYPQDRWRRWVHSAQSRCFGLFEKDALVGCTGISTWREDPSGKSAIMNASYIREAYRGRNLSDLLYRARISYAPTHPHWTRIIISHRVDNDISRRANQRHGFVYTHTRSETWPDGRTMDNLFYALDVRREPSLGFPQLSR